MVEKSNASISSPLSLSSENRTPKEVGDDLDHASLPSVFSKEDLSKGVDAPI